MRGTGPTPDGLAERDRYRSLSALAVAALLLGPLSILVLVGQALVLLPLTAIVCGVLALRRIRRAPDELSGASLARLGIALAAAGWIGAWLWLAYARAAEIPHGYTAINYEELQGDTSTGGHVPARAQELNGKKIFVKGYMYPGRQQVDLKQFIISRDNGRCTFCTPNPTPTDLVHVTLAGDLRTDYTTHLLALGGTLRVEDDPLKIAKQGLIYHLDADYLR
jgi:hypothetical protein